METRPTQTQTVTAKPAPGPRDNPDRDPQATVTRLGGLQLAVTVIRANNTPGAVDPSDSFVGPHRAGRRASARCPGGPGMQAGT